MRKALRTALVAGLVLTLVGVGTGLTLLRGHERAIGAGAAVPPVSSSPVGVLHVAVGHATAVVLAMASAMALVIGLQGILEPRGARRLAGALLLALAPVLMAVAVAADASGYLRWEEAWPGRTAADGLAEFVRLHGVQLTFGVLGVTAVVLAASAWAAPAHTDEERS